jgi:hypothetical protein
MPAHDDDVAWGGDYWPTIEQRRRAWVAELVTSSTIDLVDIPQVLTLAVMIDKWITDGHSDANQPELPLTGNVTPIRPK